MFQTQAVRKKLQVPLHDEHCASPTPCERLPRKRVLHGPLRPLGTQAIARWMHTFEDGIE